jgi:hypothetical protein
MFDIINIRLKISEPFQPNDVVDWFRKTYEEPCNFPKLFIQLGRPLEECNKYNSFGLHSTENFINDVASSCGQFIGFDVLRSSAFKTAHIDESGNFIPTLKMYLFNTLNGRMLKELSSFDNHLYAYPVGTWDTETNEIINIVGFKVALVPSHNKENAPTLFGVL